MDLKDELLNKEFTVIINQMSTNLEKALYTGRVYLIAFLIMLVITGYSLSCAWSSSSIAAANEFQSEQKSNVISAQQAKIIELENCVSNLSK